MSHRNHPLKVVLDANVLYPAPIRDLLLSLAAEGLFHPQWSPMIQEEWSRNLLHNRPEISQGQVERTIQAMDRAFPSASIDVSMSSASKVELPDPGDLHVLACAQQGDADSIVTFNLKDFPFEVVQPLGVEVLHPDKFILGLVAQNEELVRTAFQKMVGRLRNPPLSVAQVLQAPKKCQMKECLPFLN